MTLRAVSLAILATTLRLLSQEQAPPVSRIVESGPDYSVWENIEQIRTEEGFVSVTNRPIQIESGLNIQDAKGQWSLASPKLEVSKDGLLASATHLRFQASFASSAAAVSLFDVMLPDGGRLMGRVLGLAYVDQDGQSILFAEPADTGGVSRVG